MGKGIRMPVGDEGVDQNTEYPKVDQSFEPRYTSPLEGWPKYSGEGSGPKYTLATVCGFSQGSPTSRSDFSPDGQGVFDMTKDGIKQTDTDGYLGK
jgi:hypothetical protein